MKTTKKRFAAALFSICLLASMLPGTGMAVFAPVSYTHLIYHFNVFSLDCRLDLPGTARKKDLLAAMQGHILQKSVLAGHYR